MDETVLVVEDDPVEASVLCRTLETAGYRCFTTGAGEQVVGLARWRAPAVVLLDVTLPTVDGFAVCQRLRASSSVPIIMLGPSADPVERVVALRLGADDYLTKPVSAAELLARLTTLLWRVRSAVGSDGLAHEVLTFGIIRVDPARREVTRAGVVVALTPLEFDLLWFLACQPGRIHRHDELLAQVWGPDRVVKPNTLHVHLQRLRRKLETDPAHPRHFRTARGRGVRFDR